MQQEVCTVSNCARPPRLLLISTSNAVGGMERVVIGLARAFTGRGWAVRAVFPDSLSESHAAALREMAGEYGVEVEQSPAVLPARQPRTFRDMRALRSLVRESSPDVVNMHFGMGHLSIKDVAAVRFAGRHRLVLKMAQAIPWEVVGLRRRRSTRLAALLADAVIANSRGTRQHLRQAGVPAGKLRVVYNGHRPPLPLSQAEARAELGLPEDAFVVGAAGRVGLEKGYLEVVEAVGRLGDTDPAMRLVIAGDGPERPRLEARVEERLGDRGTVLGWLSDAGPLYAASDVFVLPSEREGFGNVYVEAAFYGVPSIGLRVRGVVDAVADGKTGLLLPDRDVETVARAIARLRDDTHLRAEMGEAARERALATFTERHMADGYEAVFRERGLTRDALRRVPPGPARVEPQTECQP